MCDICQRAASHRTFTGDTRDLWREPYDWRDVAERQATDLHRLQRENAALRAFASHVVEAGSQDFTDVTLYEWCAELFDHARTLLDSDFLAEHTWQGECPDSVTGWDSRDPDCPACRALAGSKQKGPDDV